MKTVLTTPTGVKLIILSVPADSYRFTLVKNKELKNRYGKFEYTSRTTGLDRVVSIDSIETYEVLGTVQKEGAVYLEGGADHAMKLKVLGGLVENFTMQVASERLTEMGEHDRVVYENYVDKQIPTENAERSFMSFLASKGFHHAPPYSFWGASKNQEATFEKLVILTQKI